MTTRIQIADSQLTDALWANSKPRVSDVGERAPEWDQLPWEFQARVRLRRKYAAILDATRSEYGDTPRGYSLFIDDLRNEDLRLVKAIPVRIDFWEGTYSAYNSDIEVFGTGATETEALDDFRFAVADLYRFFEGEGEENLGPLPLRQWRYLSAIVKKE